MNAIAKASPSVASPKPASGAVADVVETCSGASTFDGSAAYEAYLNVSCATPAHPAPASSPSVASVIVGEEK